MIIKQSWTPVAIAGAFLGFGMLSQQPVMIGLGAGLAGGIGSANLAKPRRHEGELPDLAQQVTDFAKGIQKLDQNLNNLIDRETQRDLQLNNLIGGLTAIRESSHQLEAQIQFQFDLQTQRDLQFENLIDRVTDIGAMTQELTGQVKNHKTQLSLQVKALQKLQRANHEHRGVIAAHKQEIVNCYQVISDLSNQVNQPEKVKDNTPAKQPTTHLLIDGNAMRFIEQEIGRIDYRELREVLTKGAKQVKCKFYLADTKKPAQKQFIAALEKIGFEVLLFPLVNYAGGVQRTKGDDVQMAIDAVNVQPGDRVILCGGGDGDFVPVVNRLKQMGIDFTVVAYQQNLSSHLKRVAGQNLMYLTTAGNR